MSFWKVFLVLMFVASILALLSNNKAVSFMGASILLLYFLAVTPWLGLLPERLHSKLVLSGQFRWAERLSRSMTTCLEALNMVALRLGINFDRELVAWIGNLSGDLFSQGRLTELTTLDSSRLTIAERLISDFEIANIQANVAAHFLKTGNFAEAVKLITISLGVLKTFEVIKERELEQIKKSLAVQVPVQPNQFNAMLAKCDFDLAEAELRVARTYLHMGLWTEAELHELARDYEKEVAIRRHCLELQETVSGKGHPFNVHTMAALGLALCRCGKLDEAESLITESFRLRSDFYGSQPLLLAYGMIGMGKLKWYQKNFTESDQWFEKALDIVGKMPVFTRVDEPEYLADAAATKTDLGQYETAEALFKRAIEGKLKYFLPDHPEVAAIYEKYARLLRLTGREAEAQEHERNAAAIMTNFKQRCILPFLQ